MAFAYGPRATEGIFKIGDRPFGRRCVALQMFGLLWLLTGIGLAFNPTDRFSRPGPGGALQFLDTPPTPGLPWIIGGLVGIIGGLIRPWPRDDGWGFVGLAVPPFLWALCYLWSFLAAVFTTYLDGSETFGRLGNWTGVPLFLGVTAFVLFIARWP